MCANFATCSSAAAIVSDRDLIGRAHLPADFGHALATAASDLTSLRFPLGTTVEAVERELILQTLASTNNKTRAGGAVGDQSEKLCTIN